MSGSESAYVIDVHKVQCHNAWHVVAREVNRDTGYEMQSGAKIFLLVNKTTVVTKQFHFIMTCHGDNKQWYPDYCHGDNT